VIKGPLVCILETSSEKEITLEAPPRRSEIGRCEISHATTVESRGIWVLETSTKLQCYGIVEVFVP